MELLGVLSDSHDELARLRAAANILRDRGVTTVIHCGDITSPESVALLAGLPVQWVFGNCDWSQAALRRAMLLHGHMCHGRHGTLKRAGRSIAFTHGDDPVLLTRFLESGGHDLVLHGHTHRREERRVGAAKLLNPGALRHADPPGFALVTLPSLHVQWFDLP
ncbi:MAG: metallophosphoesterase family protein [Acidobacteria bacterium]|nr:metallophosphoesterase family protein [Acidobacteriota bacterium]